LKQSIKINIINSIILLAIVVSTTFFGLITTWISDEAARGIFLAGLLIACLMFADWYQFNTTNSFKNCFWVFLVGPMLGLLIIFLNILFNNVSLERLISMNTSEYLKIIPFRLFIVGLVFPFMAVIGLLRLIIIYIFTNAHERELAGIAM
jgi:hypothetical protein